MLTMTVAFCGAGGSSTGAIQVAGVKVKFAANHSPLAIETHNTNHPNTDHSCVDIHLEDPRHFPRTDIGWFSPECKWWTVARGERAADLDPGLWDDPLSDGVGMRSRMLMFDVVRFTAHHRYRAVIVENVVDVSCHRAYAAAFELWLSDMRNLGYEHREVYLNAMHAQAGGDPAPQSRDRLYVVFWRRGDKAPDLDRWTRPVAWCEKHGAVQAVQSWKNPAKRRGRYRQQYVWRCPNIDCRHAIVEPGWLPASSVIDWSLRGQRIGDKPIRDFRSKRGEFIGRGPLSPKTMARIQAGLVRYGPHIAEVAGHTFERRPGVRTWPLDDPLRTLHTTASKALLVPVEGRTGKDARPDRDPLRTMTTRSETGILVTLRGQNAPETTGQVLDTFAAGGTHHGLIMRHNTPRGDPGQMVTPSWETLRTLTTTGHQSLLVPSGGTWNEDARPVTDPMRARTTREFEGLLIPYRSRSRAVPDSRPMPTLTTVDPAAYVVTAQDVDDCEFRMLEPAEIKRGMAFPTDYVMLGNRREQVKLAGNAVCPPAARDLISAVVEALGGTP